MDLSKLPKLSKTEAPAPPAAPVDAPGQSPPPGRGPLCAQCALPLRAGAKFCDSCGAPVRSAAGAGAYFAAEAWISIAMGVILLFFAPHLVLYMSHKVLHTKFAPYGDVQGNPTDSAYMTRIDDSGQTVVTEIRPYLKTNGENDPNFQSDLAVTLFSLALILEGTALVLSRRPVVVFFTLFITILATLYNLVFFVLEYAHYHQIAVISLFAIVIGGFMALYQFGLFLSSRATKPARA